MEHEMSGIDVGCGSFVGGDKSASALEGVVRELRGRIELGSPARAALERLESVLAQPVNEFDIPASDAAVLSPFLKAYFEEQRIELGNPKPEEAPDIDYERGGNQVDAKWGESQGWRFLCLYDLCRACEASLTNREPLLFARW
jgi:hypothetical protein